MKKITAIADRINELAKISKFSNFYDRRAKIKKTKKTNKDLIAKVFTNGNDFEGYGFHWGGLKEPQFNIGFESGNYFRYGLAISLQSTRSLPDPIGTLSPYISSLNNEIRKTPNSFSELKMWRSFDHSISSSTSVRPIPQEWITKKSFIFIGERVQISEDGVSEQQLRKALKIMESLLPLYEAILANSATQVNASAPFEPGRFKKLARICWNSNEWRRPSGINGKSEDPNSYECQNGFGHEEWLFREDWTIDGWHYGFIQGVNDSHENLVKANKAVDITLYTIEPDKRRRYIANIASVEVLDDLQADAALKAFKSRGWLKQMKEDVIKVKGNVSVLGDTEWAKHILNIRFRRENLSHFDANAYAEKDDRVIKLSRYLLYNFEANLSTTSSNKEPKIYGSSSAPNMASFMRSGSGPFECTPEHAMMQNKLMKELRNEYPKGDVRRENQNIDVSVTNAAELILFEIKSDLEARTVIRLALGQILEYAFHPSRKHTLPLSLVLVGRNAPTSDDQVYLDYLVENFGLPIKYRICTLS